MKKLRKISCNELLYVDMQDLTNSYSIQYIFETQEIKNIRKIEEAINVVKNNNYGSNIYLKNKTYYIQDSYIPIEKIEVNKENIYDSSFFKEKTDYKKESIKVYHLYNKFNNKQYLIFKFLHSTMDGKGTLMFVQNVMKYLQNKELIKCDNTITDKEFLNSLKTYKKAENKMPKLINKESNRISKYISKWKVIEIDGYVQEIVAKLSCIFANEFENDTTKIMIPTDIRRHEREKNYIGNLTLPIFLDVNKNDDYKKINGKLLYNLKDKKELNLSNTQYFGYNFYPEFIRKAGLEVALKMINKMNKFTVGALISHLGRVNLEKFNNDYITFKDFVSLPIIQPLCAFSLVILEHNNKTNIAISYYEEQFTEEYIEALVSKIKNKLNNDIYIFNDTSKLYNKNFINEIELNIKNKAEDIAIVDNSKEYKYCELEKNINKFNTIFKKKGLSKKDKVILFFNRGFDYISAVISCLNNGITFIPIDKSNTIESIKYIIKESKCKNIITDEKIALNINVINIDDIKNQEETKLKYCYEEQNIVYEIYTSGTTGTPKGVPITAKNLNNYLLWCKDEYKTDKKLIMPLFTSLSVDLTITSTLLPLIVGGTIKTYSESFNPIVLKKIIEDDEINVIKCTPTHLTFLLSSNYERNNKEIFIVGGENLLNTICEEIQNKFKDAKIYNEYGPTEATVATVFHMYDKKIDIENVPIGKPIYNTKIILVNDGKIVKNENELGEILISGQSVFNGYSNVEKQSFMVINDEKYYHTGDMGFIKNGVINCKGRIDNQVKIHGNRIELDEIRNYINEIEQVKDSIVLYENELYAFVLKEGDITKQEILNKLTTELPRYKIPSKIIFVAEISIKSGGKVDKQKLLDLLKESKSTIIIDTENKLFSIVNEVKSGLKLSMNVNLFELGLESFDILVFIQKLVNTYINSKDEEKFVAEILGKIENVTLDEIEKLIKKYGGKI